MTKHARRQHLEAVCLQDMATLAGVGDCPAAKLALGLAFGPCIRRFASDLARFDDAIGRDGIAAAAEHMVRRYGGAVVPYGTDGIAREGPLLFVANHPGLTDALAVYATGGRTDLLTLARSQPLMTWLPTMRRHMMIVQDDETDRAGSIRAMLRHLEDGGAMLLFPAGHLEPEPSLLAVGADPLGAWSPGVGSLVRLAARRGIPLRVVPTAISGVLAEPTWRRFQLVVRLRRTPQARADLAALLQLVFPSVGRTTIRIRYAEALDTGLLVTPPADAATITERIKHAVYGRLAADDRSRDAKAYRPIVDRPSSVIAQP